MKRLFKVADEDHFTEKAFKSVFPNAMHYELILMLSQKMVAGDVLDQDFPLKKVDGEVFKANLRMHAMNWDDPLDITVIAVSDLSWEKRARQEEAKKERLQGVLEMAGAVCHELNQPLQKIYMIMDDLLYDDTAYDATLEPIKKQCDLMHAVTSKLMRITRYKIKEYIQGEKIIDIDGASEGDLSTDSNN